MGRQFDGDAGSPLMYISLIVVSRQSGGGCSWSLMALLQSRNKFFWSLLVQYLIISALTPLVSAAIVLLRWMASLSSCVVNTASLRHGVARTCPRVCVRVRASSSLTCWSSSYRAANTSAAPRRS